MKLRNKKTGEIGEVGYLATSDGKIIVNNINDLDEWYEYGSLAEFNEEWEDYEEPKVYWCIISSGEVRRIQDINSDFNKGHIQIGNYFETKEEAEKAAEKLKAWKRLKDARLEFTDFGYNLEEESSSIIGADGKICFNMLCYEDFDKDLELFFGGEE